MEHVYRDKEKCKYLQVLMLKTKWEHVHKM